MPEALDDHTILQMVLQGNSAAYTTIVERYQAYVFTIVIRYVSDRETAEELAQDVFVKAYRFLRDFKGNSKFSTWLYTIANSTCLSYLRKKKDQTILIPGDEMGDRIQDYELPVSHSEQKAQRELLNEAINRLPLMDMQVITLFYQAEQSMEEIGTIVGLTPNNVKIRLFRARQKLKEILETHYPEVLIK